MTDVIETNPALASAPENEPNSTPMAPPPAVPPSVPRLARGIRWSDLVAEMENEQRISEQEAA